MDTKRVYLITGATGFIGSHLLRRLAARGEKVHIITRKNAHLWRIKDVLCRATRHISDLTDVASLRKIVEKARPTVIYHLATYGAYSAQREPDKIINTNILGTWHLLQAASRVDYELFVNTGSSSEYGFKKFAMRESDMLEPASYYAVTKSSQTLLCSHIAREEKKPIVTIRPFSVYGPHEEPTRFIPTLMKALYYNGKMSLVPEKISRDYINIDDIIDVYMLIERFKKYPGEIFNIGTGVQSSIRKVVETAVKVAERDADFRWGKMKQRMWDTTNWVADISKAQALLGWVPKVDLETGLSRTWTWYASYFGSCRRKEG